MEAKHGFPVSRIESMNLECCDVPVGAEVEYHEVGFISHRYNFYLDYY
jgi:hypothetical protein